MPKILYPTVGEVIENNKIVLELHKAKKADKHQLLGTRFQLQEIIDKSKRKSGDIFAKASVLLQELTIKHIFASGNRRTAFITAVDFISKNSSTIPLKWDSKEDIEMFKKIRYRQISEEELAKWLKSKK